jgi:PHD-finger/Bromodomain
LDRETCSHGYMSIVSTWLRYYPIGHKEHLRHFPDVLGRQTGDASRVPLWERELQRGEEAANGSWLSEEWLSKMSRDDCQYPILCRVEATCPEFPPDPYVKEVKSQNRGDCDLVCWNVPKGSATLKRMSGTPLCLAVELRPMTPLIPPYEVRGARGDLTLPPLFTVVSFPTELDPFLIPFTWAYASHCLSRGDHCTRIDDEGSSTLRVEEFAFLAGTPPSWRLEHRATDVSSILSRFDESAAKLDTLKTLLASAPPEFPVREGRYIIEVLQRLKFHFDVDASNCLSGCVIDLFELIRNTLPLWESAAVVKLANKRKQHWVSPWLLVPHDDPEFFQDFTPSELSRLLTPLCSTLREKIVLMVDDVWGRFEDSDLFYYDISERDALSYGCAVPVKTSFEKIIRRLGIGSQCFYRSADEVLSDAHMMWENCLLYNSPDSPVVESGIQIVAELREAILRTVMSHIQDRRDAQRYSKSSLCLSGAVRHDSGSLVTWDGCKSRPPPLSTVKNPFRDDIDNEWLQHISSPEMATRSSILPRTSEQQPCRNWFPQAGDQVMYSIENHKTFIVGHKAALDSAQCQLPCCSSRSQPKRCSDQENITRSPCSWCLGTVLWTKATFPRPASKKSPGEFLTTSTILAVGIRFQSEVETSVVYWRPCVFESDNIKDGDASCRVCGLRLSSSFLRSSGTSSTSLSEPLMSSLERCFILLKRRCIKQEDISSLDPSLTVENVMDGYTTPPVRIGPKSVPSFADRLIPRCKSLSPATRGVGSQCESESALKTLVEFGFLPSWMSSSLESAERVLKLHQMVSPCPKLSLELILLRLEEGFYRQTAAIENDVAEAYVNQVALLLSESTSRRKSPMSMRRIASGLQVTEDDRMWEKLDAPEEIEYSKRIAKIRDLHAMALFAIYETSHFERLLGLPLSSASLTEQDAHARSTSLRDLGRARTREGIEMLLSAVAKDLVQRSSNRAITTRIKVRCGGEAVSYSRYFAKISRAEAILDGSSTSVKVICCGKLFTARKNDDEVCGVELDTSRESPMMSLNEMKVRVRCNDSTYGPRDLCAMIPGQLGDKSLTRVVETSIRCTRSEYEESNTLVRFLVGQPGRMDRCARCQVYQRSFYYCRVVRGHLNDDFDFAGFFASDAKGVDDLLQALHPANLSSTSAANSLGQVASHNEGSIGGQAHARPIATTNGDVLCQGTPEVSPEVDPRANLERAQGAVSLASKLLQAAALYNKAPARLSHDFVSEAFPIDSSDGHYMYCVVCGLSGDLLCCDGCPNVVHQECINLTDVPEGDWFCDECNACTLAKDGTPEIGSPLPPPFGRVHFDDTEAEKLAEVLAGLFEARPDQKNGRADIPTKRSRGRPRHNQAGDGDEERDEEKGSDADSSVDGPPQKRRPGRPRKQHPSIALASMYNSPAGDTQTSMPTESDPRDSSKASENDSVKGQNSRPSRRNPRQAEVRQHNEGRETTQSIMVRGPEGVADGAMNLGEKRRRWRRSR